MHFEDHRAYLVAYTASTFGACWLVVASIMNANRLSLHLQSHTGTPLRIFKASPKIAIGALALLQAAAVTCFAAGSVHLAAVHSEAPIQGLADVLARVESEERSKSSMLAGHMLQTAVLVSFSVVLLGLWRHVPSSKAVLPHEKLIRDAYFGTIATAFTILVRTAYHLMEFFMTDPEGLEVAATSTLGFYLDLAPVFCACWAVLRQSTSLNAADELVDASPSGWPGNEKQGSVC